MEKPTTTSESSSPNNLNQIDIAHILSTISYDDLEQFNYSGDAMYPAINSPTFLGFPIPNNQWDALTGNVVVIELSEEDIYIGRLITIDSEEVRIKPENPKYEEKKFTRLDIEKVYAAQTRPPRAHNPAHLLKIWEHNPELSIKQYLFEYLEWCLLLRKDRLERPELHAMAIYELAAKVPEMIQQAKKYIGSSKQLSELKSIHSALTKVLSFTDPVELMQTALKSELIALKDCLAEVENQIETIEHSHDGQQKEASVLKNERSTKEAEQSTMDDTVISSLNVHKSQGMSNRQKILIHFYEGGKMLERKHKDYNDYNQFCTPRKRMSYPNESQSRLKHLIKDIEKIKQVLSEKARQDAESELNTLTGRLIIEK